MSTVIPGSNLVIDYFPLWNDDPNRTKLNSYSDRVDVVNIAFVLPNNDGTVALWAETNFANTKAAIANLQARGKFVNLSIGGATAQNWNLSTDQAIQTLAQNTKALVDSYGANGVDIDFEILDPAVRIKMVNYINALRKIMPIGRYLITYAGWSIGAYGQPGFEHPEWSTNKGIDINVLSQAGSLLDWVNVMSYDAFDSSVVPNFDPTQAVAAYSALMGSPSKVVMGFEIGPQSWPQGVIINTSQAKPWMQYAVNNGYRGVMFWTLSFDVNSLTKESDGAYTALIQSVMPKSTVSSTDDQKSNGTPAPTPTPTPTPAPMPGSIPGLDTLPLAAQVNILKYQNQLAYNLQTLIDSYNKEILDRQTTLTNVSSSQLASLQQQYLTRDIAIVAAEQAQEASNRTQLNAYLSQYNLSLSGSGSAGSSTSGTSAGNNSQTSGTSTSGTSGANNSQTSGTSTSGTSGAGTSGTSGTTNSSTVPVVDLSGFNQLPPTAQAQYLVYQSTLNTALQQMKAADAKEQQAQQVTLANASPDQVATLQQQYGVRNQQLQDAENAMASSNQTQLSAYLQQLLSAQNRTTNQNTPASSALSI